MSVAPAAPIMPVEPAAPILPVAERAAPEPAPAVTASLMPRALPEAAEERPLLSAPMVFEAPKPTDAQVLTEMPKTKVILPVAEPAAPEPAPAATASLMPRALPEAAEQRPVLSAPMVFEALSRPMLKSSPKCRRSR
jgi:hypothetical protein